MYVVCGICKKSFSSWIVSIVSQLYYLLLSTNGYVVALIYVQQLHLRSALMLLALVTFVRPPRFVFDCGCAGVTTDGGTVAPTGFVF